MTTSSTPPQAMVYRYDQQVFDGFSIGSNDLTQLTLGLDRDSAEVSALFDEMNEAALAMVGNMIDAAKRNGKKIGLCGQAPSDFPGYVRLLINKQIDSILFTPDALLRGIERINMAEEENKRASRVSTGSFNT